MIKQYSISDLNSLEITKNDIFEFCDFTFDYALPQIWLNSFSNWCKKYHEEITYDLIASTTIFAKSKDGVWNPIFGCTEVMWVYLEYCTNP